MAGECQRRLRQPPRQRARPSSKAHWCRRYWSGNCVPAKYRWMSWERAFRETATEIAPPLAPAPRPRAEAQAGRSSAGRGKGGREKKTAVDPEASESSIANQSIRVNVDTLEHLMTMVSETGSDAQSSLPERSPGATTIPSSRCRLQRLCRTSPPSWPGRRHEDADAADRQCLAEAAQDRARPWPANSTSRSNWRCTAPTPNSTARWLDLIKDPLTHMVRNSADHGLETPSRARRCRQAGAGHHSASRPIMKAATS